MIADEKILITGITGVVATPLAHFLAQNNEVWGIARFQDAAVRDEYERAGITTRAVDIGAGDFSTLPNDFTYVLHLAWMRAELDELDNAIRTNVEGPGLLLQHCRKAKAALVMSGMGIYSPHADPWHLYHEKDPIGRGATAYAATSPASKLGIEAVARFSARAFNLPVVIPRLNTCMGTHRTMPAHIIRAVLNGETIYAPNDPNPQSPIHIDDIKNQLEALLDAASTTALITNWCGDETIPVQDWVRWAAEFSGRQATMATKTAPGIPPGSAADPARRRSITGPCQTTFKSEFRKLFDEIVCETSSAP